MAFGQLIIGPPGSGKTTYCNGMQQYMQLTGRKVAVINLDPANDALPYECSVDIADLVSLEAVMETYSLGPNGGLLYCMEFLEQNMDWLKEKMEPLMEEGCYFLIDCPGQVELFTLHESLLHIVQVMTNKWHIRLATVGLVDAHLCTDAGKYLSALLLSLSSMLHLELPHVNVLSKADMVEAYGELSFNLEYFTEVQDLSRLIECIGEDPFAKRYGKLAAALAEVIEDFGLVSFQPLAIEDKDSVQKVLALADKATGYVFAGLAGRNPYPPEYVYGAGAVDSGASDLWEKYKRDQAVSVDITERET